MRSVTGLSAMALGLVVVLGLSSKSLVRADDAPAKTGTVSGKVLDSDGNAVKGATVSAITPPDPAAAGGGGGRANRPKPLATATTGDDGTYKLDAVPVGKVQVTARLQGKGMGRLAAPIEVTEGKDTKADDIKLAAGRGGAGGGRRGGGGNAAPGAAGN